jgi:predicted amino acid dehydrogenase
VVATKRPVTNEAWQWDGSVECGDLIVDWAKPHGVEAYVHPYEPILIVDGMPVMPTDWVIRDQFNDFYPCPDRTFQAVYASTLP